MKTLPIISSLFYLLYVIYGFLVGTLLVLGYFVTYIDELATIARYPLYIFSTVVTFSSAYLLVYAGKFLWRVWRRRTLKSDQTIRTMKKLVIWSFLVAIVLGVMGAGTNAEGLMGSLFVQLICQSALWISLLFAYLVF